MQKRLIPLFNSDVARAYGAKNASDPGYLLHPHVAPHVSACCPLRNEHPFAWSMARRPVRCAFRRTNARMPGGWANNGEPPHPRAAASVRTWHVPTTPCFHALSTGFPQRIDMTQPSKLFTHTWKYSGMLDSHCNAAGRSSRRQQHQGLSLATFRKKKRPAVDAGRSIYRFVMRYIGANSGTRTHDLLFTKSSVGCPLIPTTWCGAHFHHVSCPPCWLLSIHVHVFGCQLGCQAPCRSVRHMELWSS